MDHRSQSGSARCQSSSPGTWWLSAPPPSACTVHTIEGFCSFDVGRLKVDRSAYLVVYHLNADHLKGTTCNLSSVFEERLTYDSLTPITW